MEGGDFVTTSKGPGQLQEFSEVEKKWLIRLEAGGIVSLDAEEFSLIKKRNNYQA